MILMTKRAKKSSHSSRDGGPDFASGGFSRSGFSTMDRTDTVSSPAGDSASGMSTGSNSACAALTLARPVLEPVPPLFRCRPRAVGFGAGGGFGLSSII